MKYGDRDRAISVDDNTETKRHTGSGNGSSQYSINSHSKEDDESHLMRVAMATHESGKFGIEE